jgi:hypothetical protein
MQIETPWVEKYRPKDFEEVVSQSIAINNLKKFFCDGICKHVQYDRMDLNTILEKYGLIVYSMRLISALAPYLQKDSENSYQLDKEKLLETYKE